MANCTDQMSSREGVAVDVSDVNRLGITNPNEAVEKVADGSLLPR